MILVRLRELRSCVELIMTSSEVAPPLRRALTNQIHSTLHSLLLAEPRRAEALLKEIGRPDLLSPILEVIETEGCRMFEYYRNKWLAHPLLSWEAMLGDDRLPPNEQARKTFANAVSSLERRALELLVRVTQSYPQAARDADYADRLSSG